TDPPRTRRVSDFSKSRRGAFAFPSQFSPLQRQISAKSPLNVARTGNTYVIGPPNNPLRLQMSSKCHSNVARTGIRKLSARSRKI
ncbi:hypothetical protein HMPREF0297_0980, partial [Corynebacterium jeikeium ATCC 43734]